MNAGSCPRPVTPSLCANEQFLDPLKALAAVSVLVLL